jgi:hypothetical protein
MDAPPFPNISYLFRQDGVDLTPYRGNWKANCVFHVEKTPSLHVTDTGKYAGRYKCYGCGAEGDAVEYLRKRHNLTFKESVTRLREILNLPPDDIRHPQPLPRTRRVADANGGEGDSLADAASPAIVAGHIQDCHRLLQNQDAIQRIAEWRGYHPDLVRWAAARHLIGLRNAGARYSFGIPRETFPVTRPRLPHETTTDPDLPTALHLGSHIRLGPGTPGNTKGTRPSYRFDPPGIGSWPLVIGEPAGATILFFLEGQWDALALCQLLGWHQRNSIPATSAIIALRGAQNWRLWLTHQPLRQDAIAILFPDNDTAGSIWIEDPHGRPTFVHTLTWIDEKTPRIHRSECLAIPGGHKDLNDALKLGGLTTEDFRAALTPLIRTIQAGTRKDGKTHPTTFLAYCRSHRTRTDLYGTAARYVLEDTARPRGKPNLRTWVKHWIDRQTPDPLAEALLHLFHAWHTRQPLRPLSTFTTTMPTAPDS